MRVLHIARATVDLDGNSQHRGRIDGLRATSAARILHQRSTDIPAAYPAVRRFTDFGTETASACKPLTKAACVNAY
jgi:hypothetical protein